MKNRQPMTHRTSPEMVILFKYWFALITALVASIFVKDLVSYPAKVIPLAMLILWAVFLFTACEVRAYDKTLGYRRFLSWKQVPYDGIQECKDSWCPGLSYLSLSRRVPPWGRIYFVTARSAFSGNPKDLVDYINSRRTGAEVSSVEHEDRAFGPENRQAHLCLLMFLVGVAWPFMMVYLGLDLRQPVPFEQFPRPVAIFMAVWIRAMTWPWALATIGLLTAWIIRSRFLNGSWVAALVVGALLGSMLLKAIH